MGSPVTPADAQALIVRESDTVCQGLIKLLKIAVAAWKLCKFKYSTNGSLTPAYRTMMCAVECPPADDTNTTSENPPT